MAIDFYHNPRCTTSRKALKMLNESCADYDRQKVIGFIVLNQDELQMLLVVLVPEKFDFLATKYPKLHELKQRLDLDPDF